MDNRYFLEIEHLNVTRISTFGRRRILEDICLRMPEQEIFCLVGESGSGKTTLALSILRILPQSFFIDGGRILLDGFDVTSASESELLGVRGKSASMIFQEPGSYLNPLLPVGEQVREAVRNDRREGVEKATALLKEVGLSAACYRSYPHQLSGGMQQRVMIAMALVNQPGLLIADEPTTALDVLTAVRIVDLLRSLRKKFGMGIFFITHDLALALDIGDRIGILFAGKMMEIYQPGKSSPRHPYTEKLLQSLSDVTGEKRSILRGKTPLYSGGCRFLDCPKRDDGCAREPEFISDSELTGVRCWKQ